SCENLWQDGEGDINKWAASGTLQEMMGSLVGHSAFVHVAEVGRCRFRSVRGRRLWCVGEKAGQFYASFNSRIIADCEFDDGEASGASTFGYLPAREWFACKGWAVCWG